jgi:tRNA pseudouridine32 synthase/23S rRNA pseudouridine746 synthase
MPKPRPPLPGAPPADFVYRPPDDVPLAVIHADAQLVLVDKPAGLLSVPGRIAAHQDSLASRVAAAFPGARIVHRLDMDTSGLMVLARDAASLARLGQQFETRRVEKRYVALVAGAMPADVGRVALPLATDWPRRPKQMVDFECGKPAVTDWRVLARAGGVTRVELRPQTGRSHQLRVHMMSLGHAILGDRFYAPDAVRDAAPRLMLHEIGRASCRERVS